MTTERLDIVVTEKGSTVAKRNITDIGKTAKTTGGAIDLLKKAIFALGGVLIVSTVLNYADSFTRLQNQVRVASDATSDLNATTQRLFEISNRTRTSVEANVQLFQRLSFAGRELGATQEQLFQFVETTGIALAIQGGSAEAASGALLQLSQAIGSGIVRAEEFNSILEGAFPIALAVADGLDAAGGSVARLRSLIIKGEVSSTDFFEALLSQSDELEEAFSRTVPTIGQAFTVLRNNLISFFGTLDQGAGLTALISEGIILLAGNLDVVANVATAAGVAIAIAFGPALLAAVGSAAAAVAGFVLALGPIGLAAAALTGLVLATQEITGGLFEVEGITVQLGDVLKATFNVAGELIDDVADAMTAFLVPAFQLFGSEVTSLREILKTTFDFLVDTVDDVIGIFVGAALAVGRAFANIPGTIDAIFVSAFNLALKDAEFFVNGLIILLNTLPGVDIGQRTFDDFRLEASEAGQGAAEDISQAFRVGLGLSPVRDLVDAIGEEAVEIARLRERTDQEKKSLEDLNGTTQKALELTDKQASSLESLVDTLDPAAALQQDFAQNQELLNLALQAGQIDLERYGTLMSELTAQFAEASAELALQLNPELQLQADLLEEINGPVRDYESSVAALNELFRNGSISAEQFTDALRDQRLALLETQTDALSGVERGFLSAQADIEDFASTSEELVTNAFGNAQDAVVDFFQTGKLDADDFFSSLAEDFLRLGTQQAFAGLLGGAGSGGLDLGGLIGGLAGFVSGGSFEVGPQTSVGNLSGADNRLIAFRAQDKEQVNVTPRGQAPGGSMTQVNFNVTANDADSFNRSRGQVTDQFVNAARRSDMRR